MNFEEEYEYADDLYKKPKELNMNKLSMGNKFPSIKISRKGVGATKAPSKNRKNSLFGLIKRSSSN